MSNNYYLGSSTYRRQVPRSAWASNIESILRLTQRNLSGSFFSLTIVGCVRDPGRYYGNTGNPLLSYAPTERTSIEKFAGENISVSMSRQKVEPPLNERVAPVQMRAGASVPKVTM